MMIANRNPSIVEQLARLAKLHADGSISEDEFKALKAKLIAGVGVGVNASEAQEGNRRGNRSASDEQRPGARANAALEKKRKIAPILGFIGIFGVIVVAVGIVTLGNSPGIDCGSSATQKLVVQIAEQHPDITFSLPANIVQSMLGVQSKAGLGSLAYTNSTEGKAIIAQMEGAMKRICAPLGQGTFELRCRSGLSPELSRDAGYQSLLNEDKRLTDKAKKETTFTLDTIRMNSRDANTQAVSCTANLIATFRDGTSREEITYQVEMTSDKQLYATVEGL